MAYTRLNSIILMGKDGGTPDSIQKSIQKKQSIDGERYLDDINKHLIFIDGSPILSYYLEEIDKSKTLSDKVIIVGDRELKNITPMFTNHLNKKYHFIEQGKNRFENVINAVSLFNLHGLTYISGADLPAVTSIDERIKEIGTSKDVNFALARIENFDDFWRSPFFLNNDFKGPVANNVQGYKEPQDFIFNVDKIDLKTINELNPGTKLADPKAAMKLVYDIVKLSFNKSGVKSTVKMLSQVRPMMNARKQYLNDGNEYTYPLSKGGNLGALIDFAAPLFNLSSNDISISESKNMSFYTDLDSVQDAYFHALRMIKKIDPKITCYEELEESKYMTYMGNTSLLDMTKIRRDIPDKKKFFDYMRAREEKMLRFTDKYSYNKL